MLDINQIKEIIPHRHPFLFLDYVETLEPGIKCVAYKCVTYNEPFFAGHFPNEPVMPGVIIIEALAQAGAVTILSLEENRGKTAYFGGIDKLRFRRKVVPGDKLKLYVELIKKKANVGVGKGIATVNDQLVCEMEMTFVVGG